MLQQEKLMKTALQGLKTALTSVAAGIAVLAAVPAQADSVNGIVDIWTVGVSGQFLCGTAVFEPGTAGTSCGPTSMTWGTTTGSGQSGLSISNLAAANVNTFGGAYAGTIAPNTSVTHFNQPITGNSLDKVTLASTLTLTPFSPSGPAQPAEVMKFLIDFEETTNDPRPSACVGAVRHSLSRPDGVVEGRELSSPAGRVRRHAALWGARRWRAW
jgi:hypothetical protein